MQRHSGWTDAPTDSGPSASVIKIFLWVLACLSLHGTATASIKEYPFRVVTTASGSDHELFAVNDGPASITFACKNFASRRLKPPGHIIGPISAQIFVPYDAVPVG